MILVDSPKVFSLWKYLFIYYFIVIKTFSFSILLQSVKKWKPIGDPPVSPSAQTIS